MVRNRFDAPWLVVGLVVLACVAGPAMATPGPPTTTVPVSPAGTTGVASGEGLASFGIALALIGATLLYLRRRTRS